MGSYHNDDVCTVRYTGFVCSLHRGLQSKPQVRHLSLEVGQVCSLSFLLGRLYLSLVTFKQEPSGDSKVAAGAAFA